jgi:hypothetical protein
LHATIEPLQKKGQSIESLWPSFFNLYADFTTC